MGPWVHCPAISIGKPTTFMVSFCGTKVVGVANTHGRALYVLHSMMCADSWINTEWLKSPAATADNWILMEFCICPWKWLLAPSTSVALCIGVGVHVRSHIFWHWMRTPASSGQKLGTNDQCSGFWSVKCGQAGDPTDAPRQRLQRRRFSGADDRNFFDSGDGIEGEGCLWNGMSRISACILLNNTIYWSAPLPLA